MWRRVGYPPRVAGPSWLRRVTGSYAFELDTESLTITHLEKVTAGLPAGDGRRDPSAAE